MKTTILATVVGFAAVGTAIRLVERDPPAVAHLPIQRRRDVSAPHHRDRARRKRDGTVQVTLTNEQTLYYANASLGTPEQDFSLHIDTGSSDLWLNSAQSDLCSSRGNLCAASGTYDANSSSTYTYQNSAFVINYIDGSGATGDYVKDTLHIANLTIENYQFGVGYRSTSPQGILGLGYPINEASVNKAGLQPYNNLPAAMAGSNVVSANAYSLWLNDLESNTGSILFGGVDSAKYSGSLQTVPIIKEANTYAEFIIALTAIGQNGNQGSVTSNAAIPALLDSGSSLTYLPNPIVDSIYQAYGAQYDSQAGAAVVPCEAGQQQGSIDFTFSGATISVSISELVIYAGSTNNGQNYCIFGLAPADSSTPVLGDTFLRSAYVVYDLNSNEIGLAQTRFNVTESSVQQIATGDDGIPDATAVSNPVTSVTGLASGAPRLNGGGLATITIGGGAAHAVATPLPVNRLAGGAAIVAGLGGLLAL